MKIALAGSLSFAFQFQNIAQELINLGHEVEIPPTAKQILNNELNLSLIEEEKSQKIFAQRSVTNDAIRRYWKIIQHCDAILILNLDKNGIKNYIGGNAFLEMGFAHVLNKKIYLLTSIPEMNYKEEIEAMQPIILNNDLSKINNNL